MTIWPKSKLGNISVVFTAVPLLLALVIALAGAFQELPLAFEGEMSDNWLLTFLLLMSLASFVVSIIALVVSWSWWV